MAASQSNWLHVCLGKNVFKQFSFRCKHMTYWENSLTVGTSMITPLKIFLWKQSYISLIISQCRYWLLPEQFRLVQYRLMYIGKTASKLILNRRRGLPPYSVGLQCGLPVICITLKGLQKILPPYSVGLQCGTGWYCGQGRVGRLPIM